jgi:glutathione S-transferase
MTPPTELQPAGAALFHWGISPYCYKVRIAAAYKGVRFEERVLGLAERKAALDNTGYGKVPVIQHDGGWVTDSTAILKWLDERFDGRSLYPEGDAERAECDLLEDWADEALNAAVEPWIWLGDGRLNGLNRICADEQPALAGRLIMRAIRGVQRRMWTTRAARHGGLDATRALIGRMLALVEARLGTRAWLFGDEPCAADFAIASMLLNALRFGGEDIFEGAPRVERLVRAAGALLPDADWLDGSAS